MIGRNLAWRRNGADWILLNKRRRMGHVVPDPDQAGMWRSLKSSGEWSDIANLSWTKNAVLVAAERELEFEDRQRRAIDPPKCQQNEGVFDASSPPVRQNGVGAP